MEHGGCLIFTLGSQLDLVTVGFFGHGRKKKNSVFYEGNVWGGMKKDLNQREPIGFEEWEDEFD